VQNIYKDQRTARKK